MRALVGEHFAFQLLCFPGRARVLGLVYDATHTLFEAGWVTRMVGIGTRIAVLLIDAASWLAVLPIFRIIIPRIVPSCLLDDLNLRLRQISSLLS